MASASLFILAGTDNFKIIIDTWDVDKLDIRDNGRIRGDGRASRFRLDSVREREVAGDVQSSHAPLPHRRQPLVEARDDHARADADVKGPSIALKRAEEGLEAGRGLDLEGVVHDDVECLRGRIALSHLDVTVLEPRSRRLQRQVVDVRFARGIAHFGCTRAPGGEQPPHAQQAEPQPSPRHASRGTRRCPRGRRDSRALAHDPGLSR
mmetsp:Transcript_6891/g.13635  ORF Transcript_6891/g.13635 Transcript_6891/m.13635 type:complete len:208 (-) Transcript_6891:106-729(-)